MSLTRYLFLASLVLVCAGNITTFGVASANLDRATNIDRTESKETISEDRTSEKPKDRDLISQLNLTDEQKQKIIAIRKEYEERIQQKRSLLKTSQQDLRQMMSGNNSADSIRTRYQEVAKQRQELSDLILARMLEVREVLNGEQRSKFIQIMQSRSGESRHLDND